jgi:hypothetical protein
MARELGLTPDMLRLAAERLERGEPTLRTVVTDIEQRTGQPAADSYPEAKRYLLDGLPGRGEIVGVAGFGDQPFTALTVETVLPRARQLRALVADKRVSDRLDRGNRWRPPTPAPTAPPPRSTTFSPPGRTGGR